MTAWSRPRRPESPPGGLDPWLAAHLPELDRLSRATLPRLAGSAVVHTARACRQPAGAARRVRARRGLGLGLEGAPWFDAVTLLVNVRWSGRPRRRPHLHAVHGPGATGDDLLGLLAGLARSLVEAAVRPAPPGLPILRQFQREQGLACARLLEELWPHRRQPEQSSAQGWRKVPHAPWVVRGCGYSPGDARDGGTDEH